jgi:hypothetical protein
MCRGLHMIISYDSASCLRMHLCCFSLWTGINKTVDDRFPRFNKNRPVNRSNRPVYRACEYIGTVLGWEPDRFVYRAGPVPPGTGRTRLVPTGFANLALDSGQQQLNVNSVVTHMACHTQFILGENICGAIAERRLRAYMTTRLIGIMASCPHTHQVLIEHYA